MFQRSPQSYARHRLIHSVPLLTITFFTLYWISIKGVAKADKQFTKAKADYKTELLELSENPDVELPKFKNPLPTT